ncbi:serine/threonine protein kinase [Thermoleophilia bacterium SCSIO 60948]|nr:serine/threonine protein kinase [Thermoleophilia bacterium SCSIO 60948]
MSPSGSPERFMRPGNVLGERYRLERRIGSGGMSAVWLATDVRFDSQVAVKLLSDTLAHEEDYIARFRREASVVSELSHPNLIRLFDFSVEPPHPYLVMEYLPGGTLADRKGRDAFDGDPRSLAESLLGALAHIHSAGVIHRDVKPSNVLVAADGSPRLTDFGIAQLEDSTKLTATGEVIGTLQYMAPEVVSGQRATRRSDLYSLGMLLREVCGRRLSPALRELAARLAADDPERRPVSALAALSELRADGTGGFQPVVAGPAASALAGPAHHPPPLSRHRELVLTPLRVGIALVVVAVLLIVGAATVGDDERVGGARGATERALGLE